MNGIPVSVIVVTRNEEKRIGKCLSCLRGYSEVFVVDSGSTDKTCEIADSYGARLFRFEWNGQYPKKRQWCLENLPLGNDWVFFVDADEEVPVSLNNEIEIFVKENGQNYGGVFIQSDYVIDGKRTCFGMKNTKLCLFDKNSFYFPVVDDLDCPGMGEIEGHYQPVLKNHACKKSIKRLRKNSLHKISTDVAWIRKHKNYAQWQWCVEKKDALPDDVSSMRRLAKMIFRRLPCRPVFAFVHSYFLKLGFLDGAAGYKLAKSRYDYYVMVEKVKNTQKT